MYLLKAIVGLMQCPLFNLIFFQQNSSPSVLSGCNGHRSKLSQYFICEILWKADTRGFGKWNWKSKAPSVGVFFRWVHINLKDCEIAYKSLSWSLSLSVLVQSVIFIQSQKSIKCVKWFWGEGGWEAHFTTGNYNSTISVRSLIGELSWTQWIICVTHNAV